MSTEKKLKSIFGCSLAWAVSQMLIIEGRNTLLCQKCVANTRSGRLEASLNLNDAIVFYAELSHVICNQDITWNSRHLCLIHCLALFLFALLTLIHTVVKCSLHSAIFSSLFTFHTGTCKWKYIDSYIHILQKEIAVLQQL